MQEALRLEAEENEKRLEMLRKYNAKPCEQCGSLCCNVNPEGEGWDKVCCECNGNRQYLGEVPYEHIQQFYCALCKEHWL